MNTLSLRNSQLSSEIHIYVIDVLQPPDDSFLLLDEIEYARAVRFKSTQYRHRFIAAHTGLRKILMSYVQENPRILTSRQGKPYLPDYPFVQFSLAHSENMALCAITCHMPLGIDVEYRRKVRRIEAIAERFFSQTEYQQMKTCQDPETLFFQLWVRKEAYWKLKGRGISGGLSQRIPKGFKVYDVNPSPDYTGALVFPAVDGRKIILKDI